MKKTAIVLIIGLLTVASGTYFLASGGPPGPPPHGEPFFGGPPGPPPGPPPHRGGLFGGPPPHGGPHGLWGAPPPLVEKLKLTDDQLKQIRLAYVDCQNQTRKARMALMGLHDEKRTMLISGKIDQVKLAKCDEEIVKLGAEVMSAELKMCRDQLSYLTPEQLDGLADFVGKKPFPPGPKMKKR